MKVFICSSKRFYSQIPPIKDYLESKGHEVTLPNSYDNPLREEKIKQISSHDHAIWKGQMIRLQEEKVKKNDAILVLNYNKDGNDNYIGGATFLEIFLAFQNNKKIFLMNSIPTGILADELNGMNPIILNGNLSILG